jgi:hypothetical protein
MKSGVSKQQFMDKILDSTVLTTMIPLSILTNFFHQRFEKHSMLKSMLEIIQQLYGNRTR